MFGIRELVGRLGVFERNRVPVKIKILGPALYIQTSSLRKTARTLSAWCRASKTEV